MAPEPVTQATFVFASVAGAVIGWFYLLSKKGSVSKDAFQIITVVTVTLTFFAWLLWLCAWMHQWHPLLTPVWGED